jgi:hypothetical protein
LFAGGCVGAGPGGVGLTTGAGTGPVDPGGFGEGLFGVGLAGTFLGADKPPATDKAIGGSKTPPRFGSHVAHNGSSAET